MKNFTLILMLTSSFLFGENALAPTHTTALPATDPIEYKRSYPYGSLSLFPGVGFPGIGISTRTRNGFKGKALDFKGGIGPIDYSGGSESLFPVVVCEHNWMTFYRPTENSPYFSWGLGGALLIPTGYKSFPVPVPLLPIRAGYQYQHGFIDAGIKMAILPLPSMLIPFPFLELRAGMRF